MKILRKGNNLLRLIGILLFATPVALGQEIQFQPESSSGASTLVFAHTKLHATPEMLVVFCSTLPRDTREPLLVSNSDRRNLAQARRIELAQVWVAPSPRIGNRETSFTNAGDGAGKLFLQLVAKAGYAQCPLFLVATDVGATHFVTTLMEDEAAKVRGWSTSSWNETAEVPRRSVPGLIICRASSNSLSRMKDFFVLGRRREVPLLWLTCHDKDEARESHFLRSYIEAISNENATGGQWRSLLSGEPMDERDVRQNRESAVWLPSGNLAEAWLAMTLERSEAVANSTRETDGASPSALGITIRNEERQKGLTKASVASYTPTGEPVGTVIFVSGKVARKNREASQLLFPQWREFAQSEKVALAEIHFQSDKSLVKEGKAFTEAAAGAGSILLETLSYLGTAEKPLFLFDLDANGSRFMLDFVKWKPQLVKGWCMASWTDAELPACNIPGLMAVGVHSIDYEKMFRLFSSARSRQQPITWMPVAGTDARKGDFQDFAAEYVSSLISRGPKSAEWRSLASRESLTAKEAETNPAAASWFPDANIAQKWSVLSKVRSAPPRIVEEVVDTRNSKHPRLRLMLRLPRDEKPAAGILAFCTWETSQRAMTQRLLNEGDKLLQFADRHNLAVLTWATPQTWNTSKSFDELERKESRQIDHDFDELAAAWDRGAATLCAQYSLPDDGWLLWGISRGAQWAHRLALRKPRRFLAVHVHINSSYDAPTVEGKDLLWFASTGELEGGYPAAKRFYAACRNLGYSITFKAAVNVGHESSPQIEELRELFFEYALSVQRNTRTAVAAQNTTLRRENRVLVAPEFTSPPFVGDLINQDIFPEGEAFLIPQPQQVPLLTPSFAEAWANPSL